MKTRIVLAALALTVAITGCSTSPDQITITDPDVTATATATPAPVEAVATLEEDTGDWPSTVAYAEDMSDTLDSFSQLTDLIVEVLNMTQAGELTLSQAGELFGTAAETWQTHIDHFAGARPPAELAEVHALYMESFETFGASLEMGEYGLTNDDPDAVGTASELIGEAARVLNEANDQLNIITDSL